MVLLPAASGAQQSKEAAKADIALWSQSISAAFTPGYWEGETLEIGGDGQVVKKNSDPECIKPGEASKLGTQLAGMFARIVENADCATTAGKPGSLAFTLKCTVGGGKAMSFNSSGTYSDGQVFWAIEMNAEGEGAPRANSLRVTAKRTKTTCS
ncbi:MAG: DUF3617 family protein [Novosphingobium sp.]